MVIFFMILLSDSAYFPCSDNVDRLYARTTAKQALEGHGVSSIVDSPIPSSTDIVSPAVPADEPYSFQRHIQMQPDYEKAQQPLAANSIITSPSPLTALLTSLPIQPADTYFLPNDEKLPIPIARLPSEIMDPILSNLDVTSIERFALVCWRARYLTAISDVWKRIAIGVYKSPSILSDGGNLKELAKKHRGEWKAWVEKRDLKEGALENTDSGFLSVMMSMAIFGRNYDLSKARSLGFKKGRKCVEG